jgi:hypothetical protein
MKKWKQPLLFSLSNSPDNTCSRIGKILLTPDFSLPPGIKLSISKKDI